MNSEELRVEYEKESPVHRNKHWDYTKERKAEIIPLKQV